MIMVNDPKSVIRNGFSSQRLVGAYRIRPSLCPDRGKYVLVGSFAPYVVVRGAYAIRPYEGTPLMTDLG